MSELVAFLNDLTSGPPDDMLLERGVTASIMVLNDGVRQNTAAIYDPKLRRKHRARLVAALRAMIEHE